MFQVRVQRGPYVLAVVTGDIDLALYSGLSKMLSEVARFDGTTRVLMDCLGTTAQGLSDRDRQAGADQFLADTAGLRVALALPTPDRIAAAEVNIAHTERVGIFRSIADAEAWLLG